MSISTSGMAEMATARSRTYGLLASIFRAEPNEALLEELRGPRFAGALASLEADLGEDFDNLPGKDLCQRLGIEFTRLFMGPGTHVSPHESVFVEADGEAGGLYGAKTVEVRKFIETTGLSYDSKFTGLPDHISVELEFMGKLADFESEKWSNDDADGARYCLSVQKLFAENHLLEWIPHFSEKVAANADLPFYREMARITDKFIDYDVEQIRASLN